MMALGRNAVLLGVGVAGVSFLSNKTNRGKVKDMWSNAKAKTVGFWNRTASELDPVIERRVTLIHMIMMTIKWWTKAPCTVFTIIIMQSMDKANRLGVPKCQTVDKLV